MILLDFSQVIIGNIMANLSSEDVPENEQLGRMIRHMFFHTIIGYRSKFREYGDIVFCCDSRDGYWRKKYFPHYKGKRKANKENSKFDWDFIYHTLDTFKAELISNFRYKVIESPDAEGDDVIGVLTKYFQENDLVEEGLFTEPQKILIISGDTDYYQLQKYNGVKQYSPRMKKFIRPSEGIKEFMNEHIVRGDAGDGIPNILSQDDCFMKGIKQNSVRKAYLEKFLEHGIDACTTEMERKNYKRNQTLVDFNMIPNEVSSDIIYRYENYEIRGSKTKIMNYFLSKGMTKLVSELDKF